MLPLHPTHAKTQAHLPAPRSNADESRISAHAKRAEHGTNINSTVLSTLETVPKQRVDRMSQCCKSALKVIYAGFPGRFCDTCKTLTGPASWAAAIWFDGWFMVYEGSYWKALWIWLTR